MRLLEKYLLLLATSLALSAFAWHAMREVALPMIAAFWGIVFITPALMDFVPWLLQYQKHRALKALNGTYHAFGKTRVRVFYAANLIWVVSEDLHLALGEPLDAVDRQRLQRGQRHLTIPGTSHLGISETHLRDYVLSLRSEERHRFILWFEQQVVTPIRNKRDREQSIAETIPTRPR